MNTRDRTVAGTLLPRLEVRVYNLENERDLARFIKGNACEIAVLFSDRKIDYDPLQRVGVGVTRLGTVRAVAVGAYAFALAQLDRPPTEATTA